MTLRTLLSSMVGAPTAACATIRVPLSEEHLALDGGEEVFVLEVVELRPRLRTAPIDLALTETEVDLDVERMLLHPEVCAAVVGEEGLVTPGDRRDVAGFRLQKVHGEDGLDPGMTKPRLGKGRDTARLEKG